MREHGRKSPRPFVQTPPGGVNDPQANARVQIYKGSYEDRGGSNFRRISRWLIALFIAAAIITLILDLVAGTGMFLPS